MNVHAAKRGAIFSLRMNIIRMYFSIKRTKLRHNMGPLFVTNEHNKDRIQHKTNKATSKWTNLHECVRCKKRGILFVANEHNKMGSGINRTKLWYNIESTNLHIIITNEGCVWSSYKLFRVWTINNWSRKFEMYTLQKVGQSFRCKWT